TLCSVQRSFLLNGSWETDLVEDQLQLSRAYRVAVLSNARHHPPRTQLIKHGVSRMKAALFAVGCMPLLDGWLSG
ncbi:MAG: hypothetical protein ACREBC_28875, partial [Pyrinomonadaceae bacterium]